MRGFASRHRHPELRKRKVRRRIYAVLFLFVFIYCLIFLRVGQILNRGERELYSKKYEQALQTFLSARKYLMRKGRTLDAIAIAKLALADYPSAEEILEDLKERRFKSSAFEAKDLLEFFIDHGDYQSAKIYGEYLRSWKKVPELPFYLLLAYNGLNELSKAQDILKDCKKIEALKKRVRIQEKLINEKKKNGFSTFLFDRKSRPLLSIRFRDGDLVDHSGYQEILENEEFLSHFNENDRHNRMILTIDRDIQKMAEEAMGKYDGAFVVIKPKTGEILAAYSSETRSTRGHFVKEPIRIKDKDAFQGIKAFEKSWEPGSIMKVVTLAGVLDEGFPYSSLLPFHCEGFLGIDGTLFYDWIKHGQIDDLNEAMAVSCNIFFATLGMHLGEVRLNKTLNKFGFNSSLSHFPLPAKLGTLSKNSGKRINLFIANRAVGLRNMSLTPLHAALIASAFAHEGIIMKPMILKEKQNIEKRGYFISCPEILIQATQRETAHLISEAMRHSVENKNGTSRRARIEGWSFALKTGTSGNPRRGLDAWMIGFAPYEDPEIAFALIAEHAGKAELAGAAIAKKFLKSYLHKEAMIP